MKIDALFRTKQKSTLKIVDVKGSPQQHNTEIFYRVIGKASTSSDSPSALISELFNIQGFSSSDSKLILDLFLNQEKNPIYLVVGCAFYETGCKIRLKDTICSGEFSLTPRQIVACDQIKRGLSIEDLEMVYIHNNKENMAQERRLLSKRNQLDLRLYVS